MKMVERSGFEPLKALASRFTVCPVWPLRYLSASAGKPEISKFEVKLVSSFPHSEHGAGDGNRTHLTSLEGWRITTMLRPQSSTYNN